MVKALCRDTAIVSGRGGETGAHQRTLQARSGAHDRRAAAHTTGAHARAINELCRDRLLIVFCRDRLLKVLYHDRELSVTTWNVRPRDATEFSCCDRA